MWKSSKKSKTRGKEGCLIAEHSCFVPLFIRPEVVRIGKLVAYNEPRQLGTVLGGTDGRSTRREGEKIA